MTQQKMSKNEAYDLLGDLLGLDAKDTSGLFDQPVERKRSTPKPQWKAQSLILLFKETQCLNCKTVHRELNPLVLLHEQLIDHEGNVLKDQKTSNPLSAHIDQDKLPGGIRQDCYPMAPIHFCYECIQSFEHNYLDLFRAQLKGTLQIEAAEVSEKLKAANEAKSQAEARLLKIAETWENPLESDLNLLYGDE